MRHGIMPPGIAADQPTDLREPIDFTHPDFAMTVRMENSNAGMSRFFFSYDRGHTWRGPYRLPLFGQKGVMGRTDMIVERPARLHLVSDRVENQRPGRPALLRPHDRRRAHLAVPLVHRPRADRLRHHALVGPPLADRPGDDRSGSRDPTKSWIDAYASHDNGQSWSFLSVPEPDTGEGNPPSLLRLGDGRLCLIYGRRAQPYGILARLSGDQGKTWSSRIVLRDDAAADVGYVRSIIRPDGKIVAVYYYNDRTSPDRYLAATIWDPGKP